MINPPSMRPSHFWLLFCCTINYIQRCWSIKVLTTKIFTKKHSVQEYGTYSPSNLGDLIKFKKTAKGVRGRTLSLIKGGGGDWVGFTVLADKDVGVRRCWDHVWWGLQPLCLPWGIIAWKINLALTHFLSISPNIALLQLPNDNLYLISFPILKLSSFPLNKKTLGIQINFPSKTTEPLCFSNSYSMILKLSEILSQHYKIIWLKTFNLVLNLSLISSKFNICTL